MVERKINKIDELMQPIIDGFKNLERDFWFKDLSRYERRKLINKVFGVGFFDNPSLRLKLKLLNF